MSLDIERELVRLWEGTGLSVDALEVDPAGRVFVTVGEPSAPSSSEPLDSLPEPQDAALLLGEVIGQGGMGVVHAALQPALKREVAVKRLHPGGDGARASAALLREAWVTGNLEHPNVIPVHTLIAVEGRPAMVMKLVEGQPFSELLGARPSRLEGEEPLVFHLRLLLKVCHAVEYAHSRGFLHLDLKADNVMVGELGEVYVLDWGLSATTRADEPLPIRRAREIDGIAGTADWMAPELARADASAIGERTDVYLLGGMLHWILTASPRHRGALVIQKLVAAIRSEPVEYGPGVPAELAAIANRATAADPELRFPEARSFRRAIERFLSHRDSTRLTDAAAEGVRRLGEMRATAPSTEESTDDAEAQRLFDETRFALAQARRTWAENPAVAPALQTLLSGEARSAIAAGQSERARALLSELPLQDPELEAALAALDAGTLARAKRVHVLEELERDQDMTPGRGLRRRLGLVVAVGFSFVHLLWGHLHRMGFEIGYTQMLAQGAVMAVLVVVLGWHFRRDAFRNRANVLAWAPLVTAAVLPQLWFLASVRLGVGFWSSLALTPIFYLMSFAGTTLTIHRRHLPSTLACLAASVVAAAWPQLAFEAIGVGVAVSSGALYLATRHLPDDIDDEELGGAT